MELLLFTIAIVFVYIAWSYFMGYRKGNITLELDNRYTNFTEYIQAVKHELEEQGRTVEYKGNGTFIVDGKEYEM